MPTTQYCGTDFVITLSRCGYVCGCVC